MNKFLSTTIILFFAIISCSNEKKSSLKSGTDTTLTNADTPTQEISTVQQLKPFKTQVDTSIYLLDNYGYKDKRGNIIIPPRFMDAREFSENLAAVEVVDEEYEQKRTVSVPLTHQKTIWGYIRPDGSFQIKPRFDNAYPFKKGEAKVQIGNHLALVDTSGTILKEFDHIREKKIDENLYRIVRKDSTIGIGLMDSSSTYIVPPKYDWVTDYSEGCARFEKDDKWGYVNKKGQIVIPAQFIGVSPFINGRALVAQTVDSLVFIDTTGTNTTELMSWFEHVDTTKISNDKAETGICNCKNIQYPDLKKCAELLFGQPSSNYRVLFSAQGESSYTQDIELYSRNAFLRRHLYYEGSISTLYLRNSSYMDAKNTLVKIIENSEGKIYHKEETFRSFYFNARFKHHSGTFGVERIDTNLIKITFRQI